MATIRALNFKNSPFGPLLSSKTNFDRKMFVPKGIELRGTSSQQPNFSKVDNSSQIAFSYPGHQADFFAWPKLTGGGIPAGLFKRENLAQTKSFSFEENFGTLSD